MKREGFNKENKSARSAHKGPIATLVLRLAMNATARACGRKRGFARRALVSPLRSMASLGLAFTMAEILLSLTIIGVVAAITLPSLTGNINERTWNTQRKALYSRFSQALALMPALNGYGNLEEGDPNNVAETFVTNGLAKVLKINNICGSANVGDCGIPDKVIAANGSALSAFRTNYDTLVKLNYMFNGSFTPGSAVYSYSQTDTKTAAFETANSESILVYYNPRCVPFKNDRLPYYTQPKVCANFVYDLNGNKGPNTVGKDIGFMTALYPTDTVLAAPHVTNANNYKRENYYESIRYCTKLDNNSRLVNSDELVSIFTNQTLLWGAVDSGKAFLSSSRAKDSANYYMYLRMYSGQLNQYSVTGTSSNEYALCTAR